jgi:CheY-like chemotaxis protein
MFSQVHPNLERSRGGVGIGLALVRGLLEMHHGAIEVHSEGANRGSEFIVRLPVAGTQPAPAAQATLRSAPIGRSSCRILVADDNRDLALSLATLLRLKGHEVTVAHDGAEAVRLAEAVRPHLALIDIGMPGTNGYEAAREIRERPWCRSMRLVAMTGWGQESDKQRTREAGFDDHLTKPVHEEDIERLLAERDAHHGG